jgi:hypothetical protein
MYGVLVYLAFRVHSRFRLYSICILIQLLAKGSFTFKIDVNMTIMLLILC